MKTLPEPSVNPSVGRSSLYLASRTGASTDSASQPPSMKIDTSTGWLGPEAAEACAMPSSKWRGLSIEAPYTDSAAPAVRSRNVRRSSPVPAGIGIPGSMFGRPLPATAAPRRSNCERVKSLHEQLLAIVRSPRSRGWSAPACQLTCMSGEVAISIRSAFWRSAL